MSNTINFTISDILKEKLTLMNKIYSQNKISEVFPQAIKIDEKGMIHAANMLVSLSYKLGADEIGLVPTFPEKAFLLPDAAVKLLLATKTGTEIAINVDGNTIGIKTIKKKADAKFRALNEITFPKINAIDKKSLSVSQISSAYIERAIRSCMFSMSTNNTKPIYTGLHFISEGSTLTCFSCNGYTSAIYSTTFNGNADFSVSLPKEAISLLQICVKSASEKISLGVTNDKRRAVFVLDTNTILRTALLSGELIDYKQFFNNNFNCSFELNSYEVLSILKKINIIHTERSVPAKVILEFDENSLGINYNGKISNYSDNLIIKQHGDNLTQKEGILRIALNVDYLSEAIKAIDNETVVVCYNGSLHPIEVRGTENNTPQAIVVPMRLEN